MTPLIIGIAAFIGVAALVGGVAFMLRGQPANRLEDRLDLLTGANAPAESKDKLLKQGGVLMEPLDSRPGFVETWMNRFGNFHLLFQQADTSLTLSRLVLICVMIGIVGAGLGAATGLPFFLLPVPDTICTSESTMPRSSRACPESSSLDAACSSAFAALLCVALSIWLIAELTWSMPLACSWLAAATSAISSVTFFTPPTTRPSTPATS